MLNLPEKPTIFVQVAAYRDKDLVHTLNNIIAKAKYPDNLTFGVCWQHDAQEAAYRFLYDKRFRVLSVDWSQSKGCGWARSKTQSLYEGEDLTLQIDSHMRFEQDWDVKAVELLKQCNHPKPILTYYPPAWEWGPDGKEQLSPHTVPQALVINKFESDFVPYFGSIPLPPDASAPVMGCFIAAGFLLTIGRWCLDVPYNPNIYFLGEETDLAVRSWTKGYNIYHPHKSVCWHYFIRRGEPRHWDDHNSRNLDAKVVKEHYVNITSRGHQQLRRLLHEPGADLGPYSLGTERSLRDYELYIGINFKRRLVHPNARRQLPPITADASWEDKVKYYPTKKTITLDLSEVPILDDYEFWYFGLHDESYVEIYRNDIKDVDHLVKRQNTIEIDTVLDREPKTYTLWPVSKSKGWQTKIVRPVS